MVTNKWIEYITPNVVEENYRMLKLFSVKEGRNRENKCKERQSIQEAHKSDEVNKSKYCKKWKLVLVTKKILKE